MADVFISYARRDRSIATALARDLNSAGITTWWDVNLRGHQTFSKVIHDELDNCVAAVVIWSPNSIHSEWVHAEASYAFCENKLVTTIVDGLENDKIPQSLRKQHAEPLANIEAIIEALKALGVQPATKSERVVRWVDLQDEYSPETYISHLLDDFDLACIVSRVSCRALLGITSFLPEEENVWLDAFYTSMVTLYGAYYKSADFSRLSIEGATRLQTVANSFDETSPAGLAYRDSLVISYCALHCIAESAIFVTKLLDRCDRGELAHPSEKEAELKSIMGYMNYIFDHNPKISQGLEKEAIFDAKLIDQESPDRLFRTPIREYWYQRALRDYHDPSKLMNDFRPYHPSLESDGAHLFDRMGHGPKKRWRFWIGWLRNIYNGDPIEWSYLKDVIELPTTYYEKGPRYITTHIRGLGKPYYLRRKIKELQSQLPKRQTSGIGHNVPDSMISNASLDENINILSTSVISLEEEMAGANPDIEVLNGIKRRLTKLGKNLSNFITRNAETISAGLIGALAIENIVIIKKILFQIVKALGSWIDYLTVVI